MSYTTIDRPTDYFNTVLYTGNGTTDHAITGVGFQPDWVWLKNRSDAKQHHLFDVVRGAGKFIESSTTDAEATDTTTLSSFDSDGFTLGNSGKVNGSSVTAVSWNWLAGGTASSNTDGSITSSVSANTTAGFSVVTYTGTGSSATVGHGLGAVPKVFWTKKRNTSESWGVYHHTQGTDKFLRLESSNALDTSSTVWDDTTPTSSVFSIGTGGISNTSSGTYVAYCFAEKKGYSKFGLYTGNGSTDGTFVYTGFKPAFILNKRTTSTSMDWHIWDNKRSGAGGFNVIDKVVYPNLSNGEDTLTSLDIVSNGFKIRANNSFLNASGSPYIYMAFGQSLVGSNNIPCNAR